MLADSSMTCPPAIPSDLIPPDDGRTFPADDPRHGSTNGYNNLCCRCKPCKRAHADDLAAYRAKRRQGVAA